MYTVKTLRAGDGDAPQVSIDYHEEKEGTDTDQEQMSRAENATVNMENQPATFQTEDGSYVSLLANIATVDRSDNYQVRDPGINSNMMTYGNVSYSLCSNSQTVLAADSIVNDSNNFVSFDNIAYVTNQGDMLIQLPQSSGDLDNGDSNTELQTAVANIRNQVDNDPQDSILIASSETGTLHPVQIGANGTVHVVTDIINPDQLDLENYKPMYDAADRTLGINRDTKSSNVRVQKFTQAQLNVMGKSEKEILTDYLERTKGKRGRPKRGHTKSHEASTKKQEEELSEATKLKMEIDSNRTISSVLPNTIDGLTEDATVDKCNEMSEVKPQNEMGEPEKVGDEEVKNKVDDCFEEVGKTSEKCDMKCDIISAQESSDGVEEISTKQGCEEISTKQGCDTNEQRRSSRKRKVTEKMLQAAESGSTPKRKSRKKQIDEEVGSDAESRTDVEFFKKDLYGDRCVISLTPITLKSFESKEYVIEVEVADELLVSDLCRTSTVLGMSKYSFSVVQSTASPVKTRTRKPRDSKSVSKQVQLENNKTDTTEKVISKVASLKKRSQKDRRSGKRNIDVTLKTMSCDSKAKAVEDTNTQDSDVAKVDPQDEGSVHSSALGSTDENDSQEVEGLVDKVSVAQCQIDTFSLLQNIQKGNSTEELQARVNVKHISTDDVDNEISDQVGITMMDCKNSVQNKQESGKQLKRQSPDKKVRTSTKSPKAMKTYTTRITEDGKKEYGCPICGHTTKYSQNVQTHIAEHSDAKDFVCEECGLCFKSKNRLAKHMVVHKTDRPFTCPLCPQNFKSKQMYTCSVCSHETRIRQNMTIHTYQHTGERPYQCEVCGQTFKGPSNLHAHKQQHADTKKYSCPLCNRAFRDRGTFKQHTRRHTGDKRHVCEHCGKSFVLSTDLRKHIRVHTGEKPYKCDVCGKSFGDGSGMVRHQRMHNRKSRFQCCACNKLFTRKDLCNYHIKKVHSDLEPVVVIEVNVNEDFVKTEHMTKQSHKAAKHVDRQNKAKKSFPPKKSWQNFERLTEEATKRLQDHAIQTYSPHLGDFQLPRNTPPIQQYMNLPSSMQGYNAPAHYYHEHNQVLPLYHNEPVQNL